MSKRNNVGRGNRIFLVAAVAALLFGSAIVLGSSRGIASGTLQFGGSQVQSYVSDMYNARAINSSTPYSFVNGRKTFQLGTQQGVDFGSIVSPCNSKGNDGPYTKGIYNCQPSISSGATESHAKQATKGATSVESSNWAGWVGTSSTATATSVQGSWAVQTASPTSTPTYSSQWIGIGGFGDSTLVQTGTESDYYGGAAHYSAWYELLPASETPISGFTVSPGDEIYANITQGTSSNKWVITLTDLTSNTAFTTTVTYSSSQLSSEWIEERPEMCSGTCTLTQLASFGTSYFGQDYNGVVGTNYASMGAGSQPISGLPGLTLVSMVNQSGSTITTLAQPSALSADGTSFNVTEPANMVTTITTSILTSTTTAPTTTVPANSMQVVLVQNACAANAVSGSNTLSFPSPVNAGDMLVIAAGAGTYGGSTITSPPKDSQGNAWTALETEGGTAYYSSSGIWYATAKAGGTDAATVNFNSYIRNTVCVYELSGASAPTGAKSESAASLSASVSSLSYQPGAFLLGEVGSYESGVVTGTSGFVTDMDFPNYDLTEHYFATVAGSSTFPVNWTAGTYERYTEDAAVFNPVTTSTTSTSTSTTSTSSTSTSSTSSTTSRSTSSTTSRATTSRSTSVTTSRTTTIRRLR